MHKGKSFAEGLKQRRLHRGSRFADGLKQVDAQRITEGRGARPGVGLPLMNSFIHSNNYLRQ
jgi:hypothetical protein